MQEAIDSLIEHFGSQRALAGKLGVSPMAISHWKSRQIPLERAVQIENLTNGAVRKEQLRPDVPWPAPEAIAEEQRQAS